MSIPCLAVVGRGESGRRGVESPRGAVNHGGRESQAGRGGGAETGVSPAGGAGEPEERRQPPSSTASAPAAAPAALGVSPQFEGSALQLLTRCGTGNATDLHVRETRMVNPNMYGLNRF